MYIKTFQLSLSYTRRTYVIDYVNKSSSTADCGFQVENTFSHYKNSIAVPSQAPSNFSVTARTSTSIEASWQLPPADSRNGIIRGFKMFYKKKGSAGSSTQRKINSISTRTQVVTGLEKYTEYEFQVLAFTSVGDGPNGTLMSVQTNEDGK